MQHDPDAQRRPGGNRTASRSTGQVDSNQSIPTPPPNAALGWYYRHGVEQGALVPIVAAPTIERGLPGPIAAVVERLATLTLETLYLAQLDDVTRRIRLLADELTSFADVLDHKAVTR